MKIFGGDSGNLPSLELSGETRAPADQYVQRQVRSWVRIAFFFAAFLPWLWVYLAFAHDLGKGLPFVALAVTHVGLALIWLGRRRSRQLLTWAGIGCYLVAVALSVLLRNVL